MHRVGQQDNLGMDMEVLQRDMLGFFQAVALHFCISANVLFLGPSGFPSGLGMSGCVGFVSDSLWVSRSLQCAVR